MKKIKFLSVALILIVGVIFIFNGCQKETFSETKNDEKLHAKFVTLEQLQNNPQLKHSLKLLEKVFDINLTKDLPNSLAIETNQIINVNSEKSQTFSFKILNKVDINSDFENFVIDISKSGEIRYYILTYQFKEENTNDGTFPFNVSCYNLSEYQIEINDFHVNISKLVTIPECAIMFTVISPRDDPEYDITIIDFSDCGGSGGNGDGNSNNGGYENNDDYSWGGSSDDFGGVEGGLDNYDIPGHVGLNLSNELLNSLVIFESKDPATSVEINLQNDIINCFNTASNDSGTHSITLYVDQPVANSNSTYTINGIDVEVGHSFVSIQQILNGVTNIKTFGLYPSEGVSPDNPSSTPIFFDDGGHNFDVSITIQVSPATFDNVIYYITHINQYIGNYNYNLNSFNCSDFALNVFNISGAGVPDTTGTWSLMGETLGSGTNPGNLGQDIRHLNPLPPNSVRNTIGGTATNTNPCN